MIVNPKIHTLLTKWRQEAHTLRERYGDAVRATLVDTLAAELQEAMNKAEDVVVTLPQAADICGYKADTLGKMIRQGKLQNVGRRNAPRVRVSDLPQKLAEHSHTQPTLHIGRAALYREAARAVVANS